MSRVRRDEGRAKVPISGRGTRGNLRPRFAAVVILLFLLLVASSWVYHAYAGALAMRWDASQARDDASGVLSGAESIELGPEAAERAFEQFGSSDKSLMWVENSDHHLFWDYDRDEIIEAVVEFIRVRSEA